MRRIVLSFFVLTMAVSVQADVAVTAAESDRGVLIITVIPSGGAAIRGVALTLTRTAGDGIVADSSKVVTTGLNTFIDYGFSVPAGFDIGVGHAAANIAAPGVATFPTSSFSLSAGYLDMAGTQAGQTGVIQFAVDYDGTVNTTIQIDLDTLRGGIVGDNLGTIMGLPLTIGENPCNNECLKCTASYYGTWVDFGKPACWCFQRNCRGDANGLKSGPVPSLYVWVNSADLYILGAAYNKTVANLKLVDVGGIKGICADFNRLKSGSVPSLYVWVNSADLGILATYYNKTAVSVPICDDIDYNFWAN